MSSHYSYEIDERNLRNRLKGNEIPFNEDAWQRFENYRQIHPKPQGIEEVVKKISFTINRNVILPVLFGGVILAFSVLLFNFVSIKKKPKQTYSANTIQQHKNTVKALKELPKSTENSKVVIADTIKKQGELTAVAVSTLLNASNTTITTNTLIADEKAETIKVSDEKENVWLALESDKIFVEPNKASRVIGDTKRNEKYNAIKETVYFIKVALVSEGKQGFGYIRKGMLLKNGQPSFNNARVVLQNSGAKKKEKKAENLETLKSPSLLLPSTNEDSEPELK